MGLFIMTIAEWIRTMNSLELATWALTVFTGVLAVSTTAYTWTTYKLYKSSNKQSEVLERQIEALNKLTDAVVEIPKTEHKLKTLQKIQDRLNKSPRVSVAQIRATSGR